jgi:hypothetical protein
MILPFEITKSKYALAECATEYARSFEEHLGLEAKTTIEPEQIVTDHKEAVRILEIKKKINNGLIAYRIDSIKRGEAFYHNGYIYSPIMLADKGGIIDCLGGRKGPLRRIHNFLNFRTAKGFAAEIGHAVFDNHFKEKETFTEVLDILSAHYGISWNAKYLSKVKRKNVDEEMIEGIKLKLSEVILFSTGLIAEALTKEKEFQIKAGELCAYELLIDLVMTRHFEGSMLFMTAYCKAEENIRKAGRNIVQILQNPDIKNVADGLTKLGMHDAQKYAPFMDNDWNKKRLAIRERAYAFVSNVSSMLASNDFN